MSDDTLDFGLLFEASPDVLLVLLPDAPTYTMIGATNARLAATQTTRAATMGKSLFALFPDNPDDPAATGTANLRASLDRVLATRAPDTMAVQRYDIRDPDGTYQTKYWSPKNLPVLGASGEVRYILHRVEDVTGLVQATELGEELRDKTRAMEREVVKRSRELDAANRELRRANVKLGELDAAKTAFFSNVSHEFRTPLTLMLGPLEDAIREDVPLAGDQLRRVHRNSARLLRLVNSLLDFSRLEAGRVRAQFEPTALGEMTAGLAGAFQSLLDSAGLSLVVDCAEPREPVYVDRSQWEKVVSNLVSNAFKFTMAGEIAVRLREGEDGVELLVSDTGTGIPERELPHIFERFHRVEGAQGRSYEGSGIGLALVRELVSLHGGTVRAESELGKGTTFTVTLPRGSAHLPADRVAIEAPRPNEKFGEASSPLVLEASRWLPDTDVAAPESTPDDAATGGMRILVVDDNADMRRHIVGLLSKHWAVDTANDGKAALALLETMTPDLIVSDVMMPRMNGFELLHSLRTTPATSRVPVLLLSARAGDEAVVEALEAGADDYLLKPFSGRELLSRVRGHLSATRLRTTALRASEARLRHLAESGIIGITVSDAEHRIFEANDAFLQMVGCTREELLAGDVVWEVGGPAARRDLHGARAFEGEYLRKDGKRIPALVAIAPLENGENISVALDLTERRRLEDQFRQAQKMEAVGRLAGGIAHDFNNVLSVILSYSELVGMALQPEDPIASDIEEIRRAAVRATDLTKQLLAFSRQQVLAPKILSLRRVVGAMEQMLRRMLGADIALTFLPDTALWNIEADPGQLEQIVMNLAVNARDAMPDGGKLTIQLANVTLEEDYAAVHHDVTPGAYVLLAVSDTGIGIDDATQARIFEPFFTTKEKGRGTGLGLAMVFGIVKQSGGHIWVYSEPGRGTTFKLYFPRVPGAETTSSDRPPPGAIRGNETILLVEDDPHVRALALTILRRSGYVVLEASNGGEALLICEQHGAKIDLLVTDVVLPLMSGRQVAERLRAIRPEIKVLFMSGYTDDAVLQHGILDSGVAYLQKPMTPASLTAKVRDVLDGGKYGIITSHR